MYRVWSGMRCECPGRDSWRFVRLVFLSSTSLERFSKEVWLIAVRKEGEVQWEVLVQMFSEGVRKEVTQFNQEVQKGSLVQRDVQWGGLEMRFNIDFLDLLNFITLYAFCFWSQWIHPTSYIQIIRPHSVTSLKYPTLQTMLCHVNSLLRMVSRKDQIEDCVNCNWKYI